MMVHRTVVSEGHSYLQSAGFNKFMLLPQKKRENLSVLSVGDDASYSTLTLQLEKIVSRLVFSCPDKLGLIDLRVLVPLSTQIGFSEEKKAR
jgi:hypothetical protein